MNSRHIFTLLALAVMFLLPGRALADYTYEEPGGRFAIDLPEGWAIAGQRNENVYVFKSPEGRVIIGYLPGVSELDELYSKAVSVMQGALTVTSPEGPLRNMTISGHPARWGAYTGLVEHMGVMVQLHARLGAVSLEEGGIYFQSYLDGEALKAHGPGIEKAFRSIRNVGQEVVAPEVIQGVFSEPALANAPLAKERAFSHEYLSLTLPSDWEEAPVPKGMGKEAVGWFRSRAIGGDLLASCHRGLLASRDKAMKAAREAAEAAIEGASPMKMRRVEIKGHEVPVILYQGTEGGVPMAAVTLTVKTERCWLNLVGTAPALKGEVLEEQLIEVAESAK